MSNEVYKFILKLLKKDAEKLAGDLSQAAYQKTHTTKLDRREKTLAYIFEVLTVETIFPNEEFVLSWLNVIELLQINCRNGEAKIGLDRAYKRLQYALQKQKFSDNDKLIKCVGCGDLLQPGQSHECTNRYAKSKNNTMARDPDLLI